MVQARFVEANKENSELRGQVQTLQQQAEAARADAARADNAALQERLFSEQKNWFTQQLQPLLRQSQPAAVPALPPPAPIWAPAPQPVSAAPQAAVPAAPSAPPSGAPSPGLPSSAAFMSEEDADNVAGAAAYAEVGRLAEALSGRVPGGVRAEAADAGGGEPATAAGNPGIDGTPVATDDAAGADVDQDEAEQQGKATTRKGRAASGKKAGATSKTGARAQPAKRKASAKKAPRTGGGSKAAKNRLSTVKEDAETETESPARDSSPPVVPHKRQRSGSKAAKATEDTAVAVPSEDQEKNKKSDDGGDGTAGADEAKGTQPAVQRRVLRARKPGLSMAEPATGPSESDASDGASEAGDAAERPSKKRKSRGAKAVAEAMEQAAVHDAPALDAAPPRSPLMQPSFGSPQAMRMEDARGMVGGMADGGDGGGAPKSPESEGAPAAVWEDPDTVEVKREATARARAPLVERVGYKSHQNIMANAAPKRGTLGVHSVVGAPKPRGGGSQGTAPMRDPGTFGIVRNPMAAMTSKVMEATKAGRIKNCLSWGEKLTQRAHERYGPKQTSDW